MTAREKHTEEQIDNVAAWLRELPEQPKKTASTTRMEVVRRLRSEIHEAMQRGYDHAQIAEGLAKHGVKISAATLKNYLQRAKKGTGKKASRRASSEASREPSFERSSAPSPASKEVRQGAAEPPKDRKEVSSIQSDSKPSQDKPIDTKFATKRDYDADNASFTPRPDRGKL